MEQPCKDLSDDDGDMDVDMEDIIDDSDDGSSFRHEPMPSVSLLLMSAENKPEHIYVRSELLGSEEELELEPKDNEAGMVASNDVAEPKTSMLSRITNEAPVAKGSGSSAKKKQPHGTASQQRLQAEKAYSVSKQNAKKINEQVLKAMEDKLKGCTFSPAINERRGPRKFGKFLQEQSAKEKHKADAVAEMRAEREQSESKALQKSPKIDAISSEMARRNRSKGDSLTIYDRLHSSTITEKKANPSPSASFTFRPKLCEKSTRLVKSGKKRQQTRSERSLTLTAQDASPSPYKRSTSLNPRSAAVINRRYGKDVATVLAKWGHETLNYSEVRQTLGLLALEMKGEKDEEDGLCKDIWTYLDGERRSGVTKEALSTIILAIVSSNSKVQPNQTQTQTSASKGLIGVGKYTDQGEYVLSDSESQFLRKKYSQRISAHFLSSSSRRTASYGGTANFTFRPHINSRSSALAASARQKVVSNVTQENPRAGFATNSYIDMSAFHMSISEGNKSKKQQRRRDEEKKECTFFPKTNSKPGSRRTSPRELAVRGAKRCEELHRQSRKPVREGKTTEQRRFERERQECTFRPKNIQGLAHVRAKLEKLQESSRKARGEDTSIERIVQARKEKERANAIIQSGYQRFRQRKTAQSLNKSKKLAQPKDAADKFSQKITNFLHNSSRKYAGAAVAKQKTQGEKWKSPDCDKRSPSGSQEEKEEEPMLFIELNIGSGITEKVLMYEDEDPQGVVEMIGAKHNLNMAAREKLALIIQAQLGNMRGEQPSNN